jgi:hypothetical protein
MAELVEQRERGEEDGEPDAVDRNAGIDDEHEQQEEHESSAHVHRKAEQPKAGCSGDGVAHIVKPTCKITCLRWHEP